MTTTLPPSFPPRVVEQTETERGGGPLGWRPPEQALRGALAGAEAAIGSWLVVAVVAIAGYVATAAAPELGSAGWIDAARVGSVVWLLGHGGVLTTAGVDVTVVPLGVTLIGLVAVATSVRRARPGGWWPVATALVSYTALAAAFAALAGTPGCWRGVAGAPLVAAAGALVALRGRVPADLARVLARVPEAVRVGVAAGLRAAAVLLGLGLALVVVALVAGLPQVLDIHRSLVPDAVSTVIIVVAQLVLLPTLVVWGVAYVTGPGFAVGDGTSFAPTGIDAGPLPVVPVLGALPQPGGAAGSMAAVVVLGVLVGAATGWWLTRRRLDLRRTGAAVLVAVATAAAAVGALAALSSGAVGPGRMAVVGPDAVAVAVAVAWQLLLGTAVVTAALHRDVRGALARGRAGAVAWWDRVRG